MFICTVKNKTHVSERGEPCTKVVTVKRDKVYEVRQYETLEGEILSDNGGLGWEIVKEEKRCQEHANS